MKAIIIDGYVDEPAVFGVPPYISPYARYVYGCYAYFGVEPEYLTIDTLRKQDLWNSLDHYDQIVLIGGISVPGKYIGGHPLTYRDIIRIGENAHEPLKIIYGPFVNGYSLKGGNAAVSLDERIEELYDCPVTGNIETYMFHLLNGDYPPEDISKEEEITDMVAPLGGGILKKIPNYPYVICEIEVSSGCERETHCSFCTEPLFHGKYSERKSDSIHREIKELYKNGARYFRLGRAANILAYGDNGSGLNVAAIETLYAGIRENAPDLKMLHTDNANPGYISHYERQAAEAIQVICKYNTEGDIFSFGVESFDPVVQKKNNLGISSEDVFKAIRIVNENGSGRKPNIPNLLPGINLIFGLIGESKASYEMNFDALKKIYDEGLMLRRINLRQVMISPNTPLWNYRQTNRLKFHKPLFKKLKDRIRDQIDHEMLKRVFPLNTIIEEIIPEFHDGNITFGRKLGTYSILVGIREKLPLGIPVNVKVSEYGKRSITGEVI